MALASGAGGPLVACIEVSLRPLDGRVAAGSCRMGIDPETRIWTPDDITWTPSEKTGAREKLASTQLHQAMEGHDFVRTVTAEASRQASAKHEEKPGSFYPEKPKTSPAWGMSIDLTACIGCIWRRRRTSRSAAHPR